jgi:hypothetical protein
LSWVGGEAGALNDATGLVDMNVKDLPTPILEQNDVAGTISLHGNFIFRAHAVLAQLMQATKTPEKIVAMPVSWYEESVYIVVQKPTRRGPRPQAPGVNRMD